jgi:NAD(P)-dependent dehydrogenase (short-subunit alcohol dehydrogenase family)
LAPARIDYIMKQPARPDRLLDGRFCVVTGATRGIGLATAEALAKRGARVMLVGRDRERLESATARVASHASEGAPPLAQLADLATRAGVSELGRVLHELNTPIDVLVNNAGAIYPEFGLTRDGVERTFALNHLAPFQLTLGVHDLLVRALAARVVTVSSEAHRVARPPYDDWQSATGYAPMRAYARSKLANILFTSALARRYQGTTVTANCYHPGVVRTEFAGGTRGPLRFAFTLIRPFMRSPAAGAATGVYLASSPDVGRVSGLYFVDEKARTPSAAARDEALAESLWHTSEELTGARLRE